MFDSSDRVDESRAITVPSDTATPPAKWSIGRLQVVETDAGAELSIVVPWEFLASPTTRYPVYIDPTISSPVTDNEWYYDSLILLQSDLDIVSGGALNLYNVTLRVDHDTVNEYNIQVHPNASFNVYRSWVEPSHEKGDKAYNFNCSGNLTVQDSRVNYTYDGIKVSWGNVSLRNATVQHSSNHGIDASSGNLTLFQCVFNNSASDGVHVSNAHIDLLQSEVRDNTGKGVYLSNCVGNVSETEISANGADGLYITSGSELNVTECEVHGNTGTGIVVSNAAGLVYGTEIYSNQHGLTVSSSGTPEVINNTIHENDINGVNILSSSPTVSGNLVTDHTAGAGLNVDAGTPTMGSNALEDNEVGVLAQNVATTLTNLEVVRSTDYGVRLASGTLTLTNCSVEWSGIGDLKVESTGELTALNSYFNKGSSVLTGASGHLTVKWYLDIQVLGEFDIPWNNHQVVIKDKAGTTIFNGNTNATGWIAQQTLVEYVQSSSSWDIKSPHTIEAGDSFAHVYMSTSRQLVIYHTGDMDNDLIPDVKENLTARLWYEAESHGFGASHIMNDYYAINQKALTLWNGTEFIINKDSFYDTFAAAPQKYMLMIRASSTRSGDSIHVTIKNASQVTLFSSDFPLDTQYYWYTTSFILLAQPGRLFINVSANPGHLGTIKVDQLCMSPILKSDLETRDSAGGQITNPTVSDTDGDFMPDGGERRDASVWFEAEHADVCMGDVSNYTYSNGHAIQFMTPADRMQFFLDNYLASQGGPLMAGHYVIMVRAKSSQASSVAVDLYGTVPFSKILSINDDTLQWHTLTGLWIDPSDSPPSILNFTRVSGNFIIDKVGLILMVEDCVSAWSPNKHAMAGESTPAVFEGCIFTTTTGGNHFRIINGETGQNISINATSATKVTSPTVATTGVVYAIQTGSASTTRIKLVDRDGNVLWSNTNIPTSSYPVLGQAILGNYVVLSASTSVRCFSLASGSLQWTYSVASPINLILTSPVIYDDHIILIGKRNSPLNYYIMILDSTGTLVSTTQLITPMTPVGAPAIVNGKIIISNTATNYSSSYVEAYSFNLTSGPSRLWVYTPPANKYVATEPIIGNDTVIVLLKQNVPPWTIFTVRLAESDGSLIWNDAGNAGEVISRAPCYVEDRIYYLCKVTGQGTYLRCIDLAARINGSSSPRIFEMKVSSILAATTFGTPVLADLDEDGYLEVVFTFNGAASTGGVRCYHGGGLWYIGSEAWGQYHRDGARSGSGNYELPYYPLNPDDQDMDHDGMSDGLEVFSLVGADRFEFEDINDFSVCYMGSTYPGDMPGGKAYVGFFHQTGAALRTVNRTKDARVEGNYPDDSWVEIAFQVPTSGQYELKILPENGFEKKISKLLLKGFGGYGSGGCNIDDIRGSGYTGTTYPGTSDGYSYQGGRGNDYSRGAISMAMYQADEAYLKQVIENATWFDLYCLSNGSTNKRSDIPFLLSPDRFNARPSGIAQPSFDLEQAYLQCYFDATLNTSLSAGTTYYLRVGLDLDKVPVSLLENPPNGVEISRIDIMDIDFGLALHRGCGPIIGDTDADLLPDGQEFDLDLFPLAADVDMDGLSDYYELENLTDPGNRDSDFDGVRDGIELGCTNTNHDPYSIWDTTQTNSSLWERVMRYCQGVANNLKRTTPWTFMNVDADCYTKTDPNDPDTDDDGLPDGVIDGWFYDPIAYSKGQYTSQAVNLGLYDKAYNVPYQEKYWGFVGTFDNVAQIWEGEDFDLGGSMNVSGSWGFNDGSDGQWLTGMRTVGKETHPLAPDSDSDGPSDGYETLFAVRPPYYNGSAYIMNPTVSDSSNDNDTVVGEIPNYEIGAGASFNATITNNGFSAYAMRYVPSEDFYLDSIEIGITPQTSVMADSYGLEIFKCVDSSGFSDRRNMVALAQTSTDGVEGMYRFRDLRCEMKDNYVYWFIVKWRNADFKLNLGNVTGGLICYYYNTITTSWELMIPPQPMHIKFYTVVMMYDCLTNLQEYCAGTDPKNPDTDYFQRANMHYTDGLMDGQECKWILRTNAINGSLEYDGYLDATYINYDGDANGSICKTYNFTRTLYDGIFVNPSSGFSGAGNEVIELGILPDKTQIFMNISGSITSQAIYVWKPNSNPRELSTYSNGTKYYSGECIKFSCIIGNISVNTYMPTLEYRFKQLFLANPFKLDTDGDSLFDGQEIDWDKECDYPEAEGSTADWLNNARDRDSDNDGLMDSQEIDFDIDYGNDERYVMDTDSYVNMVDCDSDGDGINDGDELSFSQDIDGDGHENVADIDSDDDGLVDGWIDGKKWNWAQSKFINDTAPNGQFDLWEGEDSNRNGRYNKDAFESSPILNDTDNDGLRDGFNVGTPTTQFGELSNQSRFGYTAADCTNQTNPDTDGDGLSDGAEVFGWTIPAKKKKYAEDYRFEWVANGISMMSDPTKNNTDSDELSDYIEYMFSNATNTDSDSDGWLDHQEDKNKNGRIDIGETNPCDADTDGDNLADGFIQVGADDYVGEDANRNGQYDVGTESNPLDPDSDDDGVLDGPEHKLSEEWDESGYHDSDDDDYINLLDPDSDNDGLTDWEENCDSNPEAYAFSASALETNPFDNDTDNDGLFDGAEPARQSDADSDGSINAKDSDSNSDNHSDYNQTYVVFRTNAQETSGYRMHNYNASGVWIAVDKNVSILHANHTGEAINLSLLWSSAAFVYSDWTTTAPGGITELFVSKDFNITEHIEKVPLRTPEGYSLYDAPNNQIVIKISSNLYYIFIHPGNSPSGFESSVHNVQSFVKSHQEVYDYRVALGNDTDMDGLANTKDGYPNDADADDDGVMDGMEILWNTNTDGDGYVNYMDPDSDDDGVTDGTELGLTLLVPGYGQTFSGTDTDATFKDINTTWSDQRKTWTPDADPSTRTNPIDYDSDEDGLDDGWHDANHNGIYDTGDSVGESLRTQDSNLNYNGKVDTGECIPNDDDSDDDGLGDGEEKNTLSLNPNDPDWDDDGLWDGLERGLTHGRPGTDLTKFIPDNDPLTTTNETKIDTDSDTLSDGFEDADHDGAADRNETDPNEPDTDVDGLNDSIEDVNKNHIVDVNDDNEYTETDPLCNDTDADGLLDGYEEDKDGDSVLDTGETDPKLQDTDGDRLSDGIELGGWQISVYFEATGEKKAGYPITVYSDPRDPDSEDDDLTDGAEFENATDPNNSDTDGDSISDYDELTANEPSDPCGVEGTPPNLSDLDISSVPIYHYLGPLRYQWGSKLVIIVRAYDNVGLSWLEFKLKDIGTEKWIFPSGTKDSNAGAIFEKQFLNSLVTGYDLNITVSDINGNIAFLEKHINSLWEDFVAWLLDGIKSLCQFIMELASKAIEWIWNYIENFMDRILKPVINAAKLPITNLGSLMILAGNEILTEGEAKQSTIDSISEWFSSPFILTTIIIFTIILAIFKIISFFIPFIDYLLVGVLALIFTIIVIYAGAKAINCDEIHIDQSTNTDLNSGNMLDSNYYEGKILNLFIGDARNVRSANGEYIFEVGIVIVGLISMMISLFTWIMAKRFLSIQGGPFLIYLWTAYIAVFTLIDALFALYASYCFNPFEFGPTPSEESFTLNLAGLIVGYFLSALAIFEAIMAFCNNKGTLALLLFTLYLSNTFLWYIHYTKIANYFDKDE